jgi:uncharacterized membrane-anchored protein
MTARLRDNLSTLVLWVVLVAGTAILFAVSRGTPYQQFGVGLFSSAVALLVILGLFEAIWQLASRSLNLLDDDVSRKDNPNSRHRRR